MTLGSTDKRPRVLLDSNIWRYVVDSSAQGPLLRLARDGPYNVQIAPAVVYEALRLKDAPLRAALLRLMTNNRFHRLMPEAYSESMEILEEIRRVRPLWLRAVPHLQFFNRLKNDWARKMGGFWVRCARSPETEVLRLSRTETQMIEGAKRETQEARRQMLDLDWKQSPPLDKMLAGWDHPVSGWNGEMIELWRAERLITLSFSLGQPGNAYRDWLAPFVDLDNGILTSAEWREFWLHLADKSAMPRQWMRWAYSFLQRFRKISPGTPGDTQLSTYLVDTDAIITADKILLEILEACRPYAPYHLPEGTLVPAGPQGVTDLLRLLGPNSPA